MPIARRMRSGRLGYHGAGLVLPALWILAGVLVVVVRCEIVELTKTRLEPSESSLHYTQSFIRGPNAIVSLKNVVFQVTNIIPNSLYGDGDGDDDLIEIDDHGSTPIDPSSTDDPNSGGSKGDSNTNSSGTVPDGTSSANSTSSNATGVPIHNDTNTQTHNDQGAGQSSETMQNKTTNGSAGNATKPEDPNSTSNSTGNDGNGGGGLLRHLEGDNFRNGTTVQFALFKLPDHCIGAKDGCDWTEAGVGAHISPKPVQWCCSEKFVEMTSCQPGRLILTESFRGFHREINVPKEGPMTTKLKDGEFRISDTGQWVLLFTNCDSNGRAVDLAGQAVIKSEYGYLPGELFPYMYFSVALTVFYAMLVLWYLCLMRKHANSRIAIEKWILATISIGLLEMSFHTADYVSWNDTGYQNVGLAVTAIMLDVIKHAISRCLILMVSLGWGVVTDTLRRCTLLLIITLGMAYLAVGAAVDILLVVAVENVKVMSFETEIGVLNLAIRLLSVLSLISIIFTVWIVAALAKTMLDLGGANQTRKLGRYWRLTAILAVAIVCAFAVKVYWTSQDQSMASTRLVDAVNESIYLVLLIGVACLWRPNESAREYAYAMELSSDAGNDLELTVVPTGYGRDEPLRTGYCSPSLDDRFKIDDAEPA